MYGAMEEIRVNGELVFYNKDTVAKSAGGKEIQRYRFRGDFQREFVGFKKVDRFVIKKAKGVWRY